MAAPLLRRHGRQGLGGRVWLAQLYGRAANAGGTVERRLDAGTRRPRASVEQRSREMATTTERPASNAQDALRAIEPLFSRIAPALPPVQFTGTTGAKYNMGGGQPDPTSLPRKELVEIVSEVLLGDEGPVALMY